MDKVNNISFNTLNKYTDGVLKERGVRPSDQLTIRPMYGKRKTRLLNRTKYLIRSSVSGETSLSSNDIELPTVDKRAFLFELVLIQGVGIEQSEGRYCLNSLSDYPFKINGSYSYSSVIERHDRITVGYNSLEFAPAQPGEHNDEEIDIDPRVVRSGLNVLIEGETGTGKSTMARKVHDLSGRRGRFVHINLSAFSEGLIESELFGHVKGAFTGALTQKGGALLEANHGTLFLDEIDSLPLSIQTKLLLFLDNKQVRAVGSSSSSSVDVRLVFASGTKLGELVDNKQMRKDFYYRVKSGVTKTLTPLRENTEQILSVCSRFESAKGVYIDKQLINYFCTLPWPGNIRQLTSHLEKKLVLSEGRGLIYDKVDQSLSCDIEVTSCSDTMFRTLEQVKIGHATNVYRLCRNNRRHAAKALSITEATLKTMLDKDRLAS